MADVDALLSDLGVEGDALEEMVGSLDQAGWRTPTPAPGWTVAHQIGHLAWTDDVALTSVLDPAAFGLVLKEAASDPTHMVDRIAAERAGTAPGELLSSWATGRHRLVDALRGVAQGRKLDWFGPPMSAASMASARLMETWAHGQDVADGLGLTRAATDRLRHVAHIGVRTRDFAYRVHHQEPPAQAFLVQLAGPSGDTWTWGPQDAAQRVTGPALDFCLLVTQRRHRQDLALETSGVEADRWLDIAQAFAGNPGQGRRPGQFA